MDLTGFAGSPWPNAIAVGGSILLAILAFVQRQNKVWALAAVFAAVFSAAAVITKNMSYAFLIANPHAENDYASRLTYANALLFVIIIQAGVAGIFLLISSLKAGRLTGLATAMAMLHIFAAICTMSWHDAYKVPNASKPVEFVVWSPGVIWVTLIISALLTVIGLLMLLRSPKRTRS